MARKGTHVMLAVKPATRERIKQEAATLIEWMREYPHLCEHMPEVRDNNAPAFLGLSMDDLVNLLLDDRQRHRRRRKASRRASGKARRTAGTTQPGINEPYEGQSLCIECGSTIRSHAGLPVEVCPNPDCPAHADSL